MNDDDIRGTCVWTDNDLVQHTEETTLSECANKGGTFTPNSAQSEPASE